MDLPLDAGRVGGGGDRGSSRHGQKEYVMNDRIWLFTKRHQQAIAAVIGLLAGLALVWWLRV